MALMKASFLQRQKNVVVFGSLEVVQKLGWWNVKCGVGKLGSSFLV